MAAVLAFSGRLGKYLAAADLCGRSLDCFLHYEWIRTRGTDCLAFQGGLLTAYEVAWQFEFISLRQAMGQTRRFKTALAANSTVGDPKTEIPLKQNSTTRGATRFAA
jgi:hypothetical protein